ncbi:diguanylate cyclase [Methylorubrum thiocyanatum]|uniref:GGDEF domain-containing response regulator n=1 Tax=Methylorubrum TaxID=2282523 RepID=UPI00383A52AA
MHVVLVDPSRVVRRSVREMLEAGGHSVTAFDNSSLALAHVEADASVTCVLTSLEVEPLDGLELCWSLRALASDRRPLSILVMSSTRDLRPLGEVLDTGADDFMAKPPERNELWGRLRAAERVLALQRALIRQADIDQMTGIFNRTAFLRQADEAFMAQGLAGARDPVTLLLLDIDRFKAINDGYGHAGGDAVIRAVADVLRETGAVAGRLGGEEFGLLLPGHGGAGAGVAAHRVRTRCSGLQVRMPTGAAQFTVSIGIGERLPNEKVEALLRRADEALYVAKVGGRNKVAMNFGLGRTEIVS